MYHVVVALLLLLPLSAFGAELVKRSKTKAVLNFKKSELVDLETGDDIYLLDAAEEVTEVVVEKINGQLVTVSGAVGELESGIAYQVRFDKPQTPQQPASARFNAEGEGADDADDEDISTPFHLEFGYGKRWNTDKDDGTREDTISELRLAYQPADTHVAYGIYYDQITPKLSVVRGRVTKNNLKGSEFGLRLEINHLIGGQFMPFVGIRHTLHKKIQGDIHVLHADADFFGREDVWLNYEMKPDLSLDFGFRFVADSWGLFILGKKSSSESVKAKMHRLQDIHSSGRHDVVDIKAEGKFKEKFDEFSVGLWLAK